MNDNIIVLKNGKRIQLEWSFLVLEYLEEYPGGVNAIQKAIKLRQHEVKITNMLCYAVIRANIDEPLTYNEIIKLIDIKTLRTILKFIEKNEAELTEFKKKGQNYSKKKARKSH